MTNTETELTVKPKLANYWRTHEEADADTIAALDAAEAGDPRAAEMLVGKPATVSIGSDSYAATIVKVSKSLTTITVRYRGEDAELTFRYSKKFQMYRAKRSYVLTVGIAREHRDPHF